MVWNIKNAKLSFLRTLILNRDHFLYVYLCSLFVRQTLASVLIIVCICVCMYHDLYFVNMGLRCLQCLARNKLLLLLLLLLFTRNVLTNDWIKPQRWNFPPKKPPRTRWSVAYPGGFSGCPETPPPPGHDFFLN